MSVHSSASWTMEELPEDSYWGAEVQFQKADGGKLQLRCSTASLKSFTEHNEAVLEVLLAGVTEELMELLNALPQPCEGTLDIHGRNSSPFVNELQRGIAFQYWLRVKHDNTHLHLLTHEHWHGDNDTLQCIQGLRNACVSWIDSIQEPSEKKHPAIEKILQYILRPFVSLLRSLSS